jgi:hypothetical protein
MMKNIQQRLAGVLILLHSSFAMAVAEPTYTLIKSIPPFELREYSGFVVAETLVKGDFDQAGRTGFRRVAGYIFGGNQGADGSSQKIAMTAPVTLVPESPQGDAWRLHFVMPEGYQLNTLPKPNDPEVNLRKVAPHRLAAIRFSGFTTESSIAENTAKLKAWIATEKLIAASEPQIARYNDPFTLPWNRRNEILIQVQP